MRISDCMNSAQASRSDGRAEEIDKAQSQVVCCLDRFTGLQEYTWESSSISSVLVSLYHTLSGEILFSTILTMYKFQDC